MNKTITAVISLSLALGLGLGSSAYAASPSAKPKATPAPKAKEGTATHEMAEASNGSGEKGSKKVAKATTSVIKKKPVAKPSPTTKK